MYKRQPLMGQSLPQRKLGARVMKDFSAFLIPSSHLLRHCSGQALRHRSVRGFTLLELLVVMGLLALVFAVALPNMQGRIGSLEVKRAARDVASALRLAHSRAMSQSEEALFTLNATSREFTVSGREGAKTLPQHIDIKFLAARSEQQGEETSSIRFYPDGSSTGGRLVLSSGATSLAVDVNWLTGRVKIL